MEPLSVAIHSVSTVAQLRATQNVAIFGCGPVGLLCMAVAKALGATRVIAVDIVPSPLHRFSSVLVEKRLSQVGSNPGPPWRAKKASTG